MKKMTCKEMGGVCEAEIKGETSDEMMKNGKDHVHNTDDDAHKQMAEKMKTVSDEEMAKWKTKFEADFVALPDA
jgi:predicted small metal-binding protein